MSTFQILLIINYGLAGLMMLGMIFFSGKKPQRIAAWFITLTFLPFVGPLLFVLIGYGLTYHSKNMIKKRQIYNARYDEHLKKQLEEIKQHEDTAIYPNGRKDLVLLNLNNSNSVYTKNNEVTYYTDGRKMLEQLKSDIMNATSSIHLMYYIFKLDRTGNELISLLSKKAEQGVSVKLLYDSVGSYRTYKRNFKQLKQAGGKVEEFFPPLMGIKLFNLKANYRNHRKIVVIDGQIGYTGGINIRDDHMGYKKRMSPWRDTHIRIVGDAVYSLQNIFLSDWRYATNDASNPEKTIDFASNFPHIKSNGNIPVQIISSGPDNNRESIKECMIKMIYDAKKIIRIQTPYFIPDEAFVGAIKLALQSGVSVEIMMPKLADRWYVRCASFSYLKEMQKLGVKAYLYSGFLHGKTMSVDSELLTVGSCNVDIRSFALNFEVNALIYDANKTKEYETLFENDKIRCQLIDGSYFENSNIFQKILTSICRLFSAVL